MGNRQKLGVILL